LDRNNTIALFVPDLRAGGVERVRLLLAREFISRGYDVDLILLRKVGPLLDQLPVEVNIVDLKANRIRDGFAPLVRYLKAQPPKALLASMWPLTTLAIVAGKVARFNGKLVVSEHSALSLSPQNVGIGGVALRASMRCINARADDVVGVSSGVIEDLRELGLPSKSGLVIHNPVAISNDIRVPETWEKHPWMQVPQSHRLLAVGSIKPAKDYRTLIFAVKSVVDLGKKVSLLILGTGALQKDLEADCVELGLIENVHFGGFVSDPGPFYRAAGLFVLSSAWEGFGNVIVEAMAAGTPVVSTDCRSGPSEILENGRYGTLVPVGDHEALAKAIVESLTTTHDTDALRARAADFSVEKIGNIYLGLFTQ